MPGSEKKVGVTQQRPPLLNAGELKEMLSASTPLTVLDVRWNISGPPARLEYQDGHIPGAIFVDLDNDLASPGSVVLGRHPLPTPDHFQRTLRHWGLHTGDTVVVYDDAGGMSAARAWWLLRWAGMSSVYVLDGGIGAWMSAGGALTSELPAVVEGDIVVARGSMATITAEEASELPSNGVLLDARAVERYRGEVEPIDPVAGHIPGALSAPTSDNLTQSGTFADSALLADRFSKLGIGPNTKVGVYCGSGVTAAHEVLALAIVGVHAALFPGSWSQWVGDPKRPVATGDE